MRKDLSKVLCEHERSSSFLGFKQVRRARAHRDLGSEGEGQPQHESMRYRHRDNEKNFGEHLAPLNGLVRKYVGKRWDMFYSELCQRFDMRSRINQHILQHLEHLCERRILVKDNELWLDSVYAASCRPLKGSSIEFYVDPRDGIIKQNTDRKTYKQCFRERKALEQAAEAQLFKKLGAKTVLRKIGDVWYTFELEPLPIVKLVYVKPAAQDTFRVRAGARAKCWEELSDFEKECFGRRQFSAAPAIDVLTGERVYLVENAGPARFEATSKLPPELRGMYHARKKTASKQEKRRAGVA